ncbi:unnamed protein product [Protopolystoma xenopodis]|uniref:Cadherin domain-containing protein n=1 Tax=Protopolystoma xenopodis TaxID=117903 RepID=A0A448WDU8_9PLAT|nr:unnamed protein product [Protopolystoma xenopodis]
MLQIEISDLGHPTLTTVTNLIVQIIDVNDNAPSFIHSDTPSVLNLISGTLQTTAYDYSDHDTINSEQDDYDHLSATRSDASKEHKVSQLPLKGVPNGWWADGVVQIQKEYHFLMMALSLEDAVQSLREEVKKETRKPGSESSRGSGPKHAERKERQEMPPLNSTLNEAHGSWSWLSNDAAKNWWREQMSPCFSGAVEGTVEVSILKGLGPWTENTRLVGCVKATDLDKGM